MYWPNSKSVAFPVPEIIRGIQKIWAVLGYAHASFSPIFSRAFIRMDPVIVLAKFVRSFIPVPEIMAIGVLGGVRTPNLGEGEAIGGRGWYRSKEQRRAPIGPHSNFFSIFTRLRDILPLLCSRTPFFPPHL